MDFLTNHDLEDASDCQYGPPPLCHQRSIYFSQTCCDHELDEPPTYRSLQLSDAASLLASASFDRSIDFGASQHEFDDTPLYRSVGSVDSVELSAVRSLSLSEQLHDDAYPCAPVLPGTCRQVSLTSQIDELPIWEELFDLVLQYLPSQPDLFLSMRVCRSWRLAGEANYARRRIRVPAVPDALLHTVASAGAGETLCLDAGVHMLSKELILDRPLKLLGPTDGALAVLCSVTHVVVRTRCASSIGHLTMCRLGDDVGYPNTVVFAEASRLSLHGCRITCGGGATSVPQALRAFEGAPCPGEPWTSRPPSCNSSDSRAPDDQRQDRPQTGVWVGAAAIVHMSQNIISCTMGPGIKIYRGSLEAEDNTIAFSCRGANVVANGGKVLLQRNEIRGAVGDGISSWNNAQIRVEQNRIHSNSGSGVAINSEGGKVSITDNYVFNNSKAAVLFVTSQIQQATLRDNKLLEQNGGGGVQGLRQTSGKVRASAAVHVPAHCSGTSQLHTVNDASVSMEL